MANKLDVLERLRATRSLPNLQNIPIRSTLGRQIRKQMCPEIEFARWTSAQFSTTMLRPAYEVMLDEYRATGGYVPWWAEPDEVYAERVSDDRENPALACGLTESDTTPETE